MEKRFHRSVTSLEAISRFVDEFLIENAIDVSNSFSVNLIVEEIFTNIVKYGSPGGGDVSIDLVRQGSELSISVTDFDSKPFDVTQVPEVDTTRPLSERKSGGLGLHLVKTLANKIDYQYVDGNSKITVTKSIEDKHV